MDLEIQTQHVTLAPDWRDAIEQSAARITERYPETLRLHVTVRHSPHHRTGTETVLLLANVEGATLHVEKEREHMRDAIHAAFHALDVDLERHHRERRHVTKDPGMRCEGSIKRIFREGGYGFIHYQPDRDVYFNRASLRGLNFDSLEPGHPVEFEIEEGRRGPQASQVFPVGSRSRV